MNLGTMSTNQQNVSEELNETELEIRRSSLAITYGSKLRSCLGTLTPSHKHYKYEIIFKEFLLILTGDRQFAGKKLLSRLNSIESVLKKVFPRITESVDLTIDDDSDVEFSPPNSISSPALENESTNLVTPLIQTATSSSNPPTSGTSLQHPSSQTVQRASVAAIEFIEIDERPNVETQKETAIDPLLTVDLKSSSALRIDDETMSKPSASLTRRKSIHARSNDEKNETRNIIIAPNKTAQRPSALDIIPLPTVDLPSSLTLDFEDCTPASVPKKPVAVSRRKSVSTRPATTKGLPSISDYKLKQNKLLPPAIYAKPKDTEQTPRNVITVPYKNAPRPSAPEFDPKENLIRLEGIKEKIYAKNYLKIDAEKKAEMMNKEAAQKTPETNHSKRPREENPVKAADEPKVKKGRGRPLGSTNQKKPNRTQLDEPDDDNYEPPDHVLNDKTIPKPRLHSNNFVPKTAVNQARKRRSKSKLLSTAPSNKPTDDQNIKRGRGRPRREQSDAAIPQPANETKSVQGELPTVSESIILRYKLSLAGLEQIQLDGVHESSNALGKKDMNLSLARSRRSKSTVIEQVCVTPQRQHETLSQARMRRSKSLGCPKKQTKSSSEPLYVTDFHSDDEYQPPKNWPLKNVSTLAAARSRRSKSQLGNPLSNSPAIASPVTTPVVPAKPSPVSPSIPVVPPHVSTSATLQIKTKGNAQTSKKDDENNNAIIKLTEHISPLMLAKLQRFKSQVGQSDSVQTLSDALSDKRLNPRQGTNAETSPTASKRPSFDGNQNDSKNSQNRSENTADTLQQSNDNEEEEEFLLIEVPGKVRRMRRKSYYVPKRRQARVPLKTVIKTEPKDPEESQSDA